MTGTSWLRNHILPITSNNKLHQCLAAPLQLSKKEFIKQKIRKTKQINTPCSSGRYQSSYKNLVKVAPMLKPEERINLRAIAICYKPYLKPEEALIYTNLGRTVKGVMNIQKTADLKFENR